MTDDEVRLLLRELRDEPVPADSLARVRLAVLERSQRRTWFAWTMAGALAAIVLLAVWILPSRQSSTLDLAMAPAPAPPAISQAAVKAPMRVAAKRRTENRRKTASKGEVVLVRIETADPDVVILLVGD
jgi:anti-sigma factor RsiW